MPPAPWQGGSSIDFADEGPSRSCETDPVADFGLAVPEEWPMYHASMIHPEFVAWPRDHYETARTSLDPSLREIKAEFPHRRWTEVLGL